MINKIIFFVESPFNQRDYNRFGIEILQKNGFEVEVWDFTPFLHPRVHQEVKVPDPINWYKCYTFLSRDDALLAIHGLTQNCFIVCLFGYQFKSLGIYRVISKNKLPYCVFMANALPSVNSKKSGLDLFNKLKKINPYKMINAIFTRIPYNYIGIQPATLILAGGTKSTKYNYPFSKRTEILWLHTLDYDIYLNESRNPVQGDKNRGVFLDEYLPFHPDYIHSGLPVLSSPEDYYPALCKFFDFIEKKYGVHIVIAAHPRSDYEDHPDYFGGRSVIRGKTAQLVKKSGFTISHFSTAINFVILYEKPVIFITSNKLQQTWDGPFIDLIAANLGKSPINIDNPLQINWEKELSIDKDAYISYKNSYIKKSGSEELPFWQIFANRIKKLE